MASLKDLRNRIASVKATQKITKAMQMVAASKLRRAQEAAEAARPYSERMGVVLANITQAVVITTPHPDAPELIAFYTGTPLPDRQLIAWLRDYLPIYMVPRHLNHRDSLPLNLNGKIDRNALREAGLT